MLEPDESVWPLFLPLDQFKRLVEFFKDGYDAAMKGIEQDERELVRLWATAQEVGVESLENSCAHALAVLAAKNAVCIKELESMTYTLQAQVVQEYVTLKPQTYGTFAELMTQFGVEVILLTCFQHFSVCVYEFPDVAVSTALLSSLIEAGLAVELSCTLSLQWAAEKGYAEYVELLIPVSDPEADDSEALKYAAENGHDECVELLIPVCDSKMDYSEALMYAAENGHYKCVKLLIPFSDPKVLDSYALQRAAKNGHANCVELLIPVSDPKSENSKALCLAAKNGHANCVELLIPVSDPESNDSKALCLAAKNGHANCVELLIPVSDPESNDSKALRLATENMHDRCVDLLSPVK